MPYMIPPAHPKQYMKPGFGGDWATANLALQDCSSHCRDGSRRVLTKSKTYLSRCYFSFKCFVFTVNGYELWPKSNHIYIMEQLMKYGPLQVSMHIYEDFRYYKEGSKLF